MYDQRPKSSCTRGGPKSTTPPKSSLKLESKMKDELHHYDSLLEFVTSHDYLNDLTEDQFKHRLDFLKRRQRILLKNLRFCLDEENDHVHQTLIKCDESHHHHHNGQIICCRRCPTPSDCKSCCNSRLSSRPISCTIRSRPCSVNNVGEDLTLKGKSCLQLDESRANTPLLYPPGSFSCLAENQDLISYNKCSLERCGGGKDEVAGQHDKDEKTRRNEEILNSRVASVSTSKYWTSESESNIRDASPEILEDDLNNPPRKDSDLNSCKILETKSLPPRSPKRWQPTLPKPFNFMVRDEAEKYLSLQAGTETQAAEDSKQQQQPKKSKPSGKKRRIRPVPLTSKIPLYDKLVAEKEQRSRIVREVSAISLMSQVRPFKLECDRRALRSLTRSSPELATCRRILGSSSRFRAKPVPKNLFSTEIYDRMLENEYFRNLQKRVRAVDMMRTASLPPSMARRERRERCKSAGSQLSSSHKSSKGSTRGRDSVALGLGTYLPSEKSRMSAMTTVMPPRGNNLAAILRAQAAREKLEREMQERLEEKRREQLQRLRKALTARKPAWKALRTAARHEHERDLDFRVALRRVEAHEQAERHRMQMEMMLDRVMKIPTLFERYSQEGMLLQSFQNCLKSYPKLGSIELEQSHVCSPSKKKKKKKKKKQKKKLASSSSTEESYVNSTSRPDSGSPPGSSSGSSGKQCCKNVVVNVVPPERKRVSINDKAELIGGTTEEETTRQEREKRVLDDVDEITEKE